ncbi:MAG: YfiR family protein [Gammaproteobacteria bacterium]|nr:YfiR family protein [Gammaproteobacteria bacterium]
MIGLKGKSHPNNNSYGAGELKRLTIRLLICSCLMVANAMQTATAQTRIEEDNLLKAAFIYNFAKFTNWPEGTWKQQNTPLNLCTAGKDGLVSKLKHLAGKVIKQRPVTIMSLNNMQVPKNCHLLYIASSEKNDYKDILKAVHTQPVLTISELPHFARSGGMIEFDRKKDQTNFIINLAVARGAGLSINSRLLSLAEVITNEKAQ